jgi:hypothetical protein
MRRAFGAPFLLGGEYPACSKILCYVAADRRNKDIYDEYMKLKTKERYIIEWLLIESVPRDVSAGGVSDSLFRHLRR